MRCIHGGLPQVEESGLASESFPNLNLMSQVYRVNAKEILGKSYEELMGWFSSFPGGGEIRTVP